MLVIVSVVTLGACATMSGEPKPTLYKRLGGRDGIKIVVDDFVSILAGDPRVNARFKDLKPAAHQGMKITDAEWDATVEDLVKALDKNKVPEKEKSELLGVLSPMKKDIVGQ